MSQAALRSVSVISPSAYCPMSPVRSPSSMSATGRAMWLQSVDISTARAAYGYAPYGGIEGRPAARSPRPPSRTEEG
jgi:hypothetical protein